MEVAGSTSAGSLLGSLPSSGSPIFSARASLRTSGIDAPGQERLNELLHRLQAERDLTALFISHELSVVYHYATEVLCLGRGVTCLGSPRQVLTPELLNDLYGAPIEYHVHDH